ncbi:LytR C-terminal domain-containing protein [Agrococcus jejuensis]|uniref:LytR cell envelope-related transcriptional attenuator n=1 Tax=Agrococcus jejuensis TaxID=399736 RepID=A0A1G8BBV8_9MICO|nr:LytR C-terminal domain-containing protein [Agrococcus jejuensis]SDH30060.1 LytR cell envelope-related transcriptional attenuator [Agrococcus jejuensis]
MTDRFDGAPRMGRVGVHRSTERSWWRWWMTAIVAAAACVLLVVGGLGALQLLQVGSVDTSVPTGPEPITDPAALPEGTTITVLDASGAGAADAVAATLQGGGWPVAAVADASEQRDATTVYYQGADLEAAALGIAQAIGVEATEVTDQPLSGSTITVIVGTGVEPEPSSTP